MDSVTVFCARYLFTAILLLWLAAWLQAGRRLRIEMLVSLLLAGLLAVLADKIAGKLYYDPRPFVSGNVTPLFSHAPDNGFPSEHTLFSMTLAAVLYFYRPRMAWLALAIAIVVGVARILAHVHSPIDVIGGAFIGLAAGAGGYYLNQYLSNRRNSRHRHHRAV